MHWIIPPASWLGICCGDLQYKDCACYYLKRCYLWQIPIAFLVSHVGLFCPYVVLPAHQGIWGQYLYNFFLWQCIPSRWIHMPVDIFFSMPMWLKCGCFRALFVVIKVFLFFYFSWNSINDEILSLNDQYGCSSLHIWAFVDGQPSNTYSASMPKCSLSNVASLILLLLCSLVYQCMSLVHLLWSTYLVFPHLFFSWLWLDNQSAMHSHGPGLYRILILYWWMCSNILCNIACYILLENCYQWFVVCYHADWVGETVMVESF